MRRPIRPTPLPLPPPKPRTWRSFVPLLLGFLCTLAVYLGSGFSFFLVGPTFLAAFAVLVSAVVLFALLQRFAHHLGWDRD